MSSATDSLTGQQLICAHLLGPSQLQFHTHQWVNAAILLAQNLLARQAPVSIVKGKAGIHGNEEADHLAAAAHANFAVQRQNFSDAHIWGPAWVQAKFEDAWSDLNTLQQHAVALACAVHPLGRPEGRFSKTLLKAKNFAQGGLLG